MPTSNGLVAVLILVGACFACSITTVSSATFLAVASSAPGSGSSFDRQAALWSEASSWQRLSIGATPPRLNRTWLEAAVAAGDTAEAAAAVGDATAVATPASAADTPGHGDDVLIPANVSLVLDVPVTPLLNRLVVAGELTFARLSRVELLAHSVVVLGRLSIGNTSHPFQGHAIISLFGSRLAMEYSDVCRTCGASSLGYTRLLPGVRALHQPRTLTVAGDLFIYGDTSAASWSHLAATANAGASQLSLVGKSLGWSVGDTLYLGATTGDQAAAVEEVTIAAVTESTSTTYVTVAGGAQRECCTIVDLTAPLAHQRSAIVETYSGVGSVARRGEVAHVSKHVTIQARRYDDLIGSTDVGVDSYTLYTPSAVAQGFWNQGITPGVVAAAGSMVPLRHNLTLPGSRQTATTPALLLDVPTALDAAAAFGARARVLSTNLHSAAAAIAALLRSEEQHAAAGAPRYWWHEDAGSSIPSVAWELAEEALTFHNASSEGSFGVEVQGGDGYLLRGAATMEGIAMVLAGQEVDALDSEHSWDGLAAAVAAPVQAAVDEIAADYANTTTTLLNLWAAEHNVSVTAVNATFGPALPAAPAEPSVADIVWPLEPTPSGVQQLQQRHAALQVGLHALPLWHPLASDAAWRYPAHRLPLRIRHCAFVKARVHALHAAADDGNPFLTQSCLDEDVGVDAIGSYAGVGDATPDTAPVDEGGTVVGYLDGVRLTPIASRHFVGPYGVPMANMAPCATPSNWLESSSGRGTPASGALQAAIGGDVDASGGTSVSVADSVAVGGTGSAFVVHSHGAVVTRNLAMNVAAPGTFEYTETTLSGVGNNITTTSARQFGQHGLRWAGTAGFDVRGDGINVTANVASGISGSGFVVEPSRGTESAFEGCGDWLDDVTPSLAQLQHVHDNTAHDVAFGLEGFFVYHAWEAALSTWTAASLAVSRLLVLDSTIGVSTNCYGPALDSLRADAKATTLAHSMIVLRSSTEMAASAATSTDCAAARPSSTFAASYAHSWWNPDNAALMPSERAAVPGSVNAAATLGRIAVLVPTFTSHRQTPAWAPAHVATSYPAAGGFGQLHDVTVVGGGATSVCGTVATTAVDDVAVTTNPGSPDGAPEADLWDMAFVDAAEGSTGTASRLWFFPPLAQWVSAMGCGDADCDGLNHALLLDIDGSFLGDGVARTSIFPAQLRTAPRPSLPSTLLQDDEFVTLTEAELSIGDGIEYHENCTQLSDWRAYACPRPSGSKDGASHRVLVLQSLDVDSEDRSWGPMAVYTGDARLEFERDLDAAAARGFIDVLGGPMERGDCGGVYACRKRPTIYFAVVPSDGAHVTLHGQAMPPRHVRLELRRANTATRLLVTVGWATTHVAELFIDFDSTPQRDINLLSNGQRIAWDIEEYVERVPVVTDSVPSVAHDARTQEIHFVMQGGGTLFHVATAAFIWGFTEISIALTSFSEVLFVSGVGHQTGAEADAVDVRRAYVGVGSVIVEFEVMPPVAMRLPEPIAGDYVAAVSANGTVDFVRQHSSAPAFGPATSAGYAWLSSAAAALESGSLTGDFEFSIVSPIKRQQLIFPPEDPADYVRSPDPRVVHPSAALADLVMQQARHVDLGTGVFDFEFPDFYGLENETIVAWVVRTEGRFGLATVDFTVFEGTTSSRIGDYKAKFGRLSFQPYQFRRSFAISPIDDNEFEWPNENFNVGLENPQLGAALGSRTSATMWIVNDDVHAEVLFNRGHIVNWNPRRSLNAVISITRNFNTIGPASCYVVANDGTAVAGVHYQNFSRHLHWEDGSEIPVEAEDSDGNFTIPLTQLTLDLLENKNATSLYFYLNVSAFDHTIGRKGEWLNVGVRVEIHLHAYLPIIPPFRYPTMFIILACGTGILLLALVGTYVWWRHQYQPNRFKRRGHRLNSPRGHTGLQAFAGVPGTNLRRVGEELARSTPAASFYQFQEDEEDVHSEDSAAIPSDEDGDEKEQEAYIGEAPTPAARFGAGSRRDFAAEAMGASTRSIQVFGATGNAAVPDTVLEAAKGEGNLSAAAILAAVSGSRRLPTSNALAPGRLLQNSPSFRATNRRQGGASARSARGRER